MLHRVVSNLWTTLPAHRLVYMRVQALGYRHRLRLHLTKVLTGEARAGNPVHLPRVVPPLQIPPMRCTLPPNISPSNPSHTKLLIIHPPLILHNRFRRQRLRVHHVQPLKRVQFPLKLSHTRHQDGRVLIHPSMPTRVISRSYLRSPPNHRVGTRPVYSHQLLFQSRSKLPSNNPRLRKGSFLLKKFASSV